RAVLDRLDVADAEAAFAAITLAQPAGLGKLPEHDVRAPATVSLLTAMTAASGRDRVALQYASAYADVFELGLPTYRAALRRWTSVAWAASITFLEFLARFPDSHIERKLGAEEARRVCAAAAPVAARLAAAPDPSTLTEELLAF